MWINYQFVAVCPLILNFLHISSQKWLVFANFFGLPNFLPQLANFFTRIYPSYLWHFPTLTWSLFHGTEKSQSSPPRTSRTVSCWKVEVGFRLKDQELHEFSALLFVLSLVKIFDTYLLFCFVFLSIKILHAFFDSSDRRGTIKISHVKYFNVKIFDAWSSPFQMIKVFNTGFPPTSDDVDFARTINFSPSSVGVCLAMKATTRRRQLMFCVDNIFGLCLLEACCC